MFLISGTESECCGCGACVEVCPTNCISFAENNETFLFPKIDLSKCVSCKKCENVCPFNKPRENKITPKSIFFGVHKNKETVFKSSSGGAFSSVGKILLKDGYTVCGVKWNGLKVVNSFADNEKDFEKFRKSKYILSDTNRCFSKIKNMLSQGEKVLFVSTPCQVEALKNFLTKPSENLFTIDLVCHGGPGQKLFDIYIEETEKTHKNKIKEYSFRNKEPLKGRINTRSAKITFENGKEIITDAKKDPFLRAYYSRLFFRKSCLKCPFANLNRPGDITLGDGWGAEKTDNRLNPETGVSLIIINSDKGEKLLERIYKEGNMELFPISESEATAGNSALLHPTPRHRNREKFFENLKKGFYPSVKKYSKSPFFKRLYTKATRIIRKK
ncbi:MAG: Coenzyme F420 hydrogenase/dehydrogenase, beta subunit C-terminal domain [Clostridiales bacterium]|nr:Coenzyme F420 hydrogenase/dehydrogenase, beta subunit C-terminal domain [Clostridiales bacterium]